MNVFALPALLALAAQSPPASFDESQRERLTALIKESVGGVSGSPEASVSVAIAYRGKLVFAEAHGNASLELPAPATKNTVYEIASISKQFTAAAVMRLVERGTLRIEDEASKFVSLPPPWADIKIKHLLNHSSGIHSYTEATAAFGAIAQTKQNFETVLGLVVSKPLAFKPGTGFLYSNTNYLILARIVEKVTGQPFAEVLQSSVIEPAGLHSTRLCDRRDIVPNRARGYRELAGRLTNAPTPDLTVRLGASGMCSTPSDLVRWALVLQDGKVVSDHSYKAMTEPSSPGYGFALAVENFAGHEKVYHGGNTWGFCGTVDNHNHGELVIAVLSNLETGPVEVVAEQVARFFYGMPPLERAQDLPLTEAEATRYLGDYAVPRVTTHFMYRGGHLVEQSLGQPEPDYYDTFLNQGGGIFVMKNTTNYIKFFTNDEQSHATGMAYGDGKTWRAVNKLITKATAVDGAGR